MGVTMFCIGLFVFFSGVTCGGIIMAMISWDSYDKGYEDGRANDDTFSE